MNKSSPLPLFAIASVLAATVARAQMPPDKSHAEPPGSVSPARPAHSAGAAAEENSPAGNKANPADAQSPPLADPLKQDAVQDPPQAIVSPATRFTTSALLEGMTEVRLARLAQMRSENARVRQLAGLFVSDQEKSNSALAAIAARKSITAPSDLDADHQAPVKRLEALHGAALDRAFLDQMAATHVRAIALFTAAAAEADPELATFAKQSLPVLRAHQQQTESLQATLKPAKAN